MSIPVGALPPLTYVYFSYRREGGCLAACKADLSEPNTPALIPCSGLGVLNEMRSAAGYLF